MMSLAFDDSRMSLDNDLSNLSPCKGAAVQISLLSSTEPDSTSASVEPETIEKAKTSNQVVNLKSQSKRQESATTHSAFSQSWADMVQEEEDARQNSELEELSKIQSSMELAATDSKMSIEEVSSSSSISGRSTRQIEIDILDSANVEKYEKLVMKDMIKSPFKRRLSGGCEEDDDGHAKFIGEECDGDELANNQHKKTKKHEDDHGRERFRRDSSSSGEGSSNGSQNSRKPLEFEKDVSILVRRQKQIDYGKNTLGYESYLEKVPRDQRTKDHPKTPPKHFKYSRRAWDGLIKVWRKKLHCFDPNVVPGTDD
ncbi:histone RNA hairpin-binding protein [Topomyia yanbarensis]|uniref:histone RNA hairpin-binding protein n=1 Tax=Topomyia yanbarensis TaxID=2498891 RepID=UPI00273AA798|nr:histone RNA hairpin-binding protein [Topomyia yanbarensis]